LLEKDVNITDMNLRISCGVELDRANILRFYKGKQLVESLIMKAKWGLPSKSVNSKLNCLDGVAFTAYRPNFVRNEIGGSKWKTIGTEIIYRYTPDAYSLKINLKKLL